MPDLDLREQIARIDRMQQESWKFFDEQHKLMAEERKLYSEEWKLMAEERKLRSEDLKLARDRTMAPRQIVVTAMGAGAALFAAGAAFLKLLGA